MSGNKGWIEDLENIQSQLGDIRTALNRASGERAQDASIQRVVWLAIGGLEASIQDGIDELKRDNAMLGKDYDQLTKPTTEPKTQTATNGVKPTWELGAKPDPKWMSRYWYGDQDEPDSVANQRREWERENEGLDVKGEFIPDPFYDVEDDYVWPEEEDVSVDLTVPDDFDDETHDDIKDDDL
jgi:hypothetical protein